MNIPGRMLTAMVTPFNDKGEVDYDQAKKLALALMDSGSEGLIVVGTTGESPTLVREEEYELFRVVKEAVGDRVVGIQFGLRHRTGERDGFVDVEFLGIGHEQVVVAFCPVEGPDMDKMRVRIHELTVVVERGQAVLDPFVGNTAADKQDVRSPVPELAKNAAIMKTGNIQFPSTSV